MPLNYESYFEEPFGDARMKEEVKQYVLLGHIPFG